MTHAPFSDTAFPGDPAPATAPPRRRAFTFAAALSLVVLIATASLWAWSFAEPNWQFGAPAPLPGAPTQPGRSHVLSLSRGQVSLSTLDFLAQPPPVGPGHPYGVDTLDRSIPGLRYHRDRLTLQSPDKRNLIAVVSHTTTISLWLGVPLLLSAILPAAWLLRAAKARLQKRPGTCRKCGYDLRASTNRCPECGTAIAPTPAAV